MKSNTSGPSRPLFEAFARCLDVGELEETVLGVLCQACPGRRALVSLRGRPEPSLVSGPEGRARTWATGQAVPAMLAMTVQDEGEVLGWIGYIEEDDEAPVRPAKRALRQIAEAAAIPTRNAQRHSEALELAMRDPLSGLFNRRAFEAFLEREVRSISRTGRALSLILLDIDDFKAINDRFGHLAGDDVIRQVAEAIDSCIRRTDVAARYGGDEFAILLPESEAATADQLAERILRALQGCALAAGAGRIAASMGIADLAASGGQIPRLMSLADEALYAAKRAGGNCVVVSEVALPPDPADGGPGDDETRMRDERTCDDAPAP